MMEKTGTRERGFKRPKLSKNRPSRAAAYGTRARANIVPFSAPMDEIRKMSAAIGAAFAPANVWTAFAATDGASGYAVELDVATSQKGSAYKYATLTNR